MPWGLSGFIRSVHRSTQTIPVPPSHRKIASKLPVEAGRGDSMASYRRKAVNQQVSDPFAVPMSQHVCPGWAWLPRSWHPAAVLTGAGEEPCWDKSAWAGTALSVAVHPHWHEVEAEKQMSCRFPQNEHFQLQGAEGKTSNLII